MINKPHFRLLLITLLSLIYFQNVNAQIYINEFMASNDATITDEIGEYEDWVEVYNAGNAPVNLAGYYWTDDLTALTLSQIPSTNAAATTVPAGGFLLFWFDKDLDQGILHVDAKLGAGGEDLALVSPNGTTIIDSYTFGPQLANVSEGRVPDGGSSFDFYVFPTPNATNDTDPGAAEAVKPVPSLSGGHYDGSIAVSLSTTTAGATIYYTLDGSVPTSSSLEYTGAISLSDVTSLRAIASSPPMADSEVLTETYLIDISHVFPIVTLAGNPDDFFGENGIIPNYQQDLEIPVNVEFFETDGQVGFNQLVEVEINGTASASFSQKSFALKAKGSLGDDTFSYPVFPTQDRDTYRSLVLRNSGNDWSSAFFRDALVTSLVRDLSDIGDLIDAPKVHSMDYRPCITYLNGDYYGIYNIRERPDKRYIKTHFGLDDNEIDFIENDDEVKEGDIEAWQILHNELASTDYSNNANFSQLAAKIDVDEYMDYAVFQLFADNQDWPGNNQRRFRERTPDGKWRWILYDLDFSFGLFTSEGWNTGYAGDNSLDRLLNPTEYSWPNPEWGARLFNNLVENEEWRTRFINRMADQINVLYQPDRINGRVDTYLASYQPEKDQSNALWGNLWEQDADANLLKIFASSRIPVVYSDFEEAFSEITGTSNITINALPADKGGINFSTVHLDEDDYSWTGTYFDGVEIPVVAVPQPGYVLDHWSGALSGSEASTHLVLSQNANLTAHFSLGSTSTAGIVFNEINYNSSDAVNSGDWVEFHNPTSASVDISGWYFQDEEGGNFVFPANTNINAGGYLVIAEDLDNEFAPNYPNVSNVIGDFGDASIFDKIKLSNGGEILKLYNANGILIDEVDYDDNSPWADTADGDGPSLQLVNPSLNNALAASWAAWEPTPGEMNTGGTLLSQTITFSAISDKLTTDTPFQISAFASSGLGVSLAVLSGPATISGNTITLTGQVGTVTVQASQNGNGIYNPATPVLQSFQVTEPQLLSQTITFSAISDKLTTDTPFQISASASSGLGVSLAVLSGPATISGNTITLTGQVGTVTVQASQNGNGIYNPAPQISQSFEVIEDTATENCASAGNQPWHQWIRNVSFGEIDNTSAKEGYADFTAQSTNIEAGSQNTISLTAGYSWFTYTEYWTVWIDYNQNGVFEEPQEIAFQTIHNAPPNGTLTDEISGTISVPSAIVEGSTKMRVSMKKGAFASPCEIFEEGEVEDYTVVLTETVNTTLNISCPPNQNVTTTTSSAIVNWNTPTTIGNCAGNPVITQNSGNENGSSFPIGTTTITYQATDNCNNSAICSFAVTVTEGEYCTPTSNYPWHEWISRVTFSNINNASGKTPYSDFTDLVANVQPGATYPITLTAGYSYFTFLENWRVWIDYDQNGNFENDEMVFLGTLSPPANGTINASINGNIAIPTNTSLGTTRMRVSMRRNAFASPCGPIDFGEYEDYTVNIEPTLALTHSPSLFFEVRREATNVLLHWATNTEYKNDYFEIEHSFDNQNFNTIIEVESRQEETYSMRTYQEYDTPEKGTHYYRVKQTDIAGNISYSNQESIVFDLNKNEMHVFPNPVREMVFVSAPSLSGKSANIQLLNSLGTPLQEIKFERFPLSPTGLSVHHLHAGIYFIALKIEGQRVQTKRIIVTK